MPTVETDTSIALTQSSVKKWKPKGWEKECVNCYLTYTRVFKWAAFTCVVSFGKEIQIHEYRELKSLFLEGGGCKHRPSGIAGEVYVVTWAVIL